MTSRPRAARYGFVWLALATMATTAAAQTTPALALVNANVVDVERGVAIPGQTILTSGDRIVRVGPASTRIPSGHTRVDLRGAWVIPGLWDMHVHIATGDGAPDDLIDYYGSLFLANGVTAVRDVGGSARTLRSVDSASRARPGTMPRMVYSGEKIGSPPADAGWQQRFADSLEARLAGGATFGKLVPEFPAERVPQALGVCERLRVRCVTHIPAADTGQWLNKPGRGSYEHLFNLPEHVSSEPHDRMFASAEEYVSPTVLQRILYKLRLRKRPADPVLHRVAVRDTTQDREFFARVARSGAWFTPTLTLHQYMTRGTRLDAAATDSTLSMTTLRFAERSPAEAAEAARVWDVWAGIARALSSSGANLLAGTDFMPSHVPGAILHAELSLLQDAGVPAADVLRMATLNPARYFNATESLGAVSAGRVADLVVLRRNPLEDVRRVGEIEMVVMRGQLMRRPKLDSLIASARMARERIRTANASQGSR